VALGVLKQTADVATAFWTFVIALHTFCLVCMEVRPGRLALWTTLVGGWCGIGLIVIIGPTVQNVRLHGPFCQSSALLLRLLLTFRTDGISGYWCWISPEYTTSHVTYVFFLSRSESRLTLLRLDYMFASLESSIFLWCVYQSPDVFCCRIQLFAIHPGFPSDAWFHRIRKRTYFIPEDCQIARVAGKRR
jgi:hypothetical protein